MIQVLILRMPRTMNEILKSRMKRKQRQSRSIAQMKMNQIRKERNTTLIGMIPKVLNQRVKIILKNLQINLVICTRLSLTSLMLMKASRRLMEVEIALALRKKVFIVIVIMKKLKPCMQPKRVPNCPVKEASHLNQQRHLQLPLLIKARSLM